MKDAHLETLLRARKSEWAAVLLTFIESGEQHLLEGDWESQDLAIELQDIVKAAVREDDSHMAATSAGQVFVHVFNPRLRMFIVGAVHIAQSLASMATLTGYNVTIVDPRRAFATDVRFPDIAIDHRWPDKALTAQGLDARCAVVTLSHDPKLDDRALKVTLQSDAFYVGSLGSRRTHSARLERLRQEGFSDEQLSRIRGPIGLDIGAKSNAEIATAILAEVTQVLRT